MKIGRLPFSFTLLFLLAGCGSLGLQGQILSPGEATATVSAEAAQTAKASLVTPAPLAISPGQVFEFTLYIHPRWRYQLAIPNGSKTVQSEDERHTTFSYQDTNLIRGSFIVEVNVITPETGSADEVVKQITAQQAERSEVQTVTAGEGQLTGAAISFAAGPGEHCPSMRALTVVFTSGRDAFALGIHIDAEEACDAAKFPQTAPVIESFRLLSNGSTNLAIRTETPAAEILSWKELIAPNLIADVDWRLYTGQLQGSEKGILRDFTLSYPTPWVVMANPNPAHFAVQNVPETVGSNQVSGDFVKLEVVPVKGALSEPTEGEEQAVQVAGQTATLWTNVTAPGQALRTSLTLEKDGVFYVLAGYVNLPNPDQAALDRYRMMLLKSMFSFQIK